MQQQLITVSAIVAMSENRVIGVNNQLPWHLPADLRHFKELTTGHAILMGRKTYESIGRPLPNRLNLIMTRDPAYLAEGCITVNSLQDALDAAKQDNKDHLFVIGGAEIYSLLLSSVSELYLTIVHHFIEGDTIFPALNDADWDEAARIHHAADDKNEYPYSFITLVRKTR